MTILSRRPVTKVALPQFAATPRISCPRCATVNCTRHNPAATLTTRAVPAQWKGA